MIPWKHGGRPKRANPEERFHVEVARFLNLALPSDSYWTTIPTVGSSMFQGAKLKAKGYLSGTPDLVICWRGRAFWVELKAPGGNLSPQQQAAHYQLQTAGCKATVVMSLPHLEEWLRAWGIPLRATLAPEPAQVKAARETA